MRNTHELFTQIAKIFRYFRTFVDRIVAAYIESMIECSTHSLIGTIFDDVHLQT